MTLLDKRPGLSLSQSDRKPSTVVITLLADARDFRHRGDCRGCLLVALGFSALVLPAFASAVLIALIVVLVALTAVLVTLVVVLVALAAVLVALVVVLVALASVLATLSVILVAFAAVLVTSYNFV